MYLKDVIAHFYLQFFIIEDLSFFVCFSIFKICSIEC